MFKKPQLFLLLLRCKRSTKTSSFPLALIPIVIGKGRGELFNYCCVANAVLKHPRFRYRSNEDEDEGMGK